ncbi:MAG: phenylalanine--tRNA ligase subunit alpha [Bacteroidia bacterium]|nr:phenylalanine--tRNA ligase subunit alpha [Bacteroidia bacterium]MDW8133561.1 phenylalanine--tRNA ligase subunit alpha [Bacteroidia bacterium]
MNLESLAQEISESILDTPEKRAAFQRRFLRKGGVLDGLFAELPYLPPEVRKERGKVLNALRQAAQRRLEEAERTAPSPVEPSPRRYADPTFPHVIYASGGRHPLSIVERRIIRLFQRMGYSLAEGPEIEDEWHNFSALNFEPDHPARDMQDTFFIEPEKGILLRTHTSTVQIRVMEKQKPPLRILAPGRVYRHETISARSHVYFHQVEGLCVEEDLSAADLKATLTYFLKGLFGESIRLRWRASYFPFTEMSAEVDVSCLICGGEGCSVCKQSGWVEVLGCGMVDPNVLSACGIDPQKYRGFAFGLGVERLTQLLYNIPDIRLFSQNDIRFLKSFQTYAPLL